MIEKQIIIKEIHAKFTRDFDTFGKMDPFLQFKVNQVIQKTEVAEQAGKQPKWNSIINLKITYQNQIEVTAFDDDATQNQYIGVAKISISTLKNLGEQKFTFIGEDNKSIGTGFFKYQIKQILTKYVNHIRISQITAKFTKNFDTFGKMEPFVAFSIGNQIDQTQLTQYEQQGNSWNRNLLIGYNSQKQLKISAYDHDVTQNQFIGSAIVDLKSLKPSGKQQITLLGAQKQNYGTLNFKYQIFHIQIPSKKVEEPIKKQGVKKQVKSQVIQPKVQQNNPENLIIDILGKKWTEISQKKPNGPNIINTIDSSTIVKNQSQDINNNIVQRESLRRTKSSFRISNYGDKIFNNHSSTNLRKSVLAYSIPKASRFGNGPKFTGQPNFYVDTCFKPNSTKGVGFGSTRKKLYPQWLQKKMKQGPAPTAYFNDQRPSSRSKGPTFGISHKYYQKVVILRQMTPQKSQRFKINHKMRMVLRIS